MTGTVKTLQALVLVGAVMALAGGVGVLGWRWFVRTADAENAHRVRNDLRNLRSDLELYVAHFGECPSEREGVEALVKRGILDSAPLDPWDGQYVFQRAGADVVILSYGADRVAGGADSAADISLGIGSCATD